MEWFSLFFQNLSINLDRPFITLILFFIAGLLSALFPCYYPLIPITAGYLQKRSENQKPWIHPLYYWMGSLTIYTLLGLTASIGGVLFSKLMQNGWVIFLLGLIYLYLSYSMIDFVVLDFSFFRKLENKATMKNSTFSTFLMGMVAGLAASACVSPALVSILLFIAQLTSSVEKDFFSFLFSIFLSTIYGAGLGIPFLLTGILGAKLPKIGKWMNLSKYFLASLVFFIALYQIDKGIRVFQIDDKISSYMVGTIFFLIVISYLIGKWIVQKRNLDIFQFNKIFAYSSIIIIFLIVTFFIQALGSKSNKSQNINQENYGVYEEKKNIKIFRNYFEALDVARKENKPLFIDFYADWCTNCVEFSKLIEKDEQLNQALQKSVFLKIYDHDSIFEEFSKKENYQELQIGLPFFVIIDPQERILFKTTNFKDTIRMIKTIENYKNNL